MVPRKRNYHIYSKHFLWVNSANLVYFSILSVFPKLGLHFLSRANLGHLVFLFFRIVQLNIFSVRANASSWLSSINLRLTIFDVHLYRTASLIWLSVSKPKLQSLASFVDQVSNCTTVSPSFCWSWRHVSRAKVELTLGTKYPFRTVVGASSTVAWPVSAATVERIS